MSKIIWNQSQAISPTSSQSVAMELLSKRGLNSHQIKKFSHPDYAKDLEDPFSLPDMSKAVSRLAKAIANNQKIAIYGDYDIDGLSSCAMLGDALTQMGSKPELYIPDRFEEGYGLNSGALEKLKAKGVDLVVTVDCGTTAHQQVSLAKKIGLDIIITDHHEPDNGAPKDAIACVNPKLLKDSPLKDLAGVGVAFYLVRGLQIKHPSLLPSGNEKWLLDLVALGTICDVVPLIGDNRVLAKYGLKVLRLSKRVGLHALAESSGMELSRAHEADLGFKMGPRLNAAGRLAHAKKALVLLTTDDPVKATKYANELSELNRKRQETTKNIYFEANEQAKKYKRDPILVLSSPDWSHGVVGIVASKIAEKWHKPTIILQEMADISKGSARSYNSFSIVDAIRSCEEILLSFGGHSFAAGLKLSTERIEELRYRIGRYAVSNMDAENNFKTLNIGLNLVGSQASLGLYDSIVELAPFGSANKKPYCHAKYVVDQVRLVGSDASHLRLLLRDDEGNVHTAIGFSMARNFSWLESGQTIEIVFELSENIWQNRRSHQLEILDMRIIEQ